MATIESLEQSKELLRIEIPLKPGWEFEDRRIHATPEFMAWLRGSLWNAKAFYDDSLSPRQQAYELLKHFITGKPMRGSQWFKQMKPLTDDVWELTSTLDVRFFGWFYRTDHYIAVSGGLFEDLKDDRSLYEAHRIKVVKTRSEIQLDAPKYKPGAGENDVVWE